MCRRKVRGKIVYPPLNKGLQGTSNEAGVDFGGSRRKKKEGVFEQ